MYAYNVIDRMKLFNVNKTNGTIRKIYVWEIVIPFERSTRFANGSFDLFQASCIYGGVLLAIRNNQI